jgi:hypothetical protein
MKLALIVAATVVGGTLLATQGPRGQILAAFSRGSTAPQYLGYVEGETTLVAPPVAGRLVVRPTFDDIAGELAALGVILIVVSILAISRYRITLDGAAKPAA